MERIGRYRIVKEIGRGAMGIVYLATDPTIGRSVAIKTVRLRDVDNAQQREKLRERLFREARSAGVLSHPNIVTIYDMAEEDGVAYIAMEYVDGPTFEDIMASGKSLDSSKMFAILRQTATALDYAHTKGIIHRDIKPANIMLGRDGNVKVTDFGIAKINAAADSYTITGTLVGTPNYMSPEQVQGTEVTGRSDQFSLAVIAYEILTGERPFPGEQLSTVVYKIVAEDPVSPQRLNRTLGPYIEGVLRKGLSKKPGNRYRTCAEFVGSLETTCAATKGWTPVVRGASLNQSTMSGLAPAAKPSIPNPPAQKNPPRKERELQGASTQRGEVRRSGSKILPLAAAFLMVVGVFSLLTWQGGDTTPAAQTDQKQDQPKSPDQKAPDQKPQDQKPPDPKPVDQTTPAPSSPDSPDPAPPEDNTAQRPTEKPTTPPATEPLQPVVLAAKPAPKPSPMQSVEITRPAGKPQDLSVATNPPGARAIIDGGSGPNCMTPCTLEVSPGLHSLSLRLDGYQEERREVHVSGEAQDVPLVSLRRAAGLLMLTTVPPGAAITINDRLQSQVTPAQITLPPATYRVMVQKDGHRVVDSVEIHNGDTSIVNIALQ
jgi:serine/threonine protein kinase